MPARVRLYHAIEQRIRLTAAPAGVPRWSIHRLARLITGVVAARSAVLARIAGEVAALQVSQTREPAHVERGLRRTLNDPHLTAAICYTPALRSLLAAWGRGARLILAIDDSSQDVRVHLLRASLCYRGTALPLAWATWAQNVRQPRGSYWRALDAVLAQVATLLPADAEVIVVADRAFDVPAFVDRVAAHGWHWVVRAKAASALVFRDARGRQQPLRHLLGQHLPAPGHRWKHRGQVFKRAGWRAASVVAYWAPAQQEPVVVLSDLPPAWVLLRWYDRRFWIEASFRQDKRGGWQWEQSRVRGITHQAVLLLALAWASLLTLCLGTQEATRRLTALAARPSRPRVPQPPRASLFTLGLQISRRWLYGTATDPLTWTLAHFDAPCWLHHWHAVQCAHSLRATPVRL